MILCAAGAVRVRLTAICCALLISGGLALPVAAQGRGQGPQGVGQGLLNQGRQIRATLVQGLNFGNVGNNPAASGSATIDPASGGKTVSGGATNLGGIHSPAIFDIRGDSLRAFAISLPTQITIAGPGGSTTTVDNFTSNPAIVGVLDSTGKATVTVGATLQVGGSLSNGAYTNVFDITVAYQ